jgi:hypothetical protein
VLLNLTITGSPLVAAGSDNVGAQPHLLQRIAMAPSNPIQAIRVASAFEGMVDFTMRVAAGLDATVNAIAIDRYLEKQTRTG